LYERTCLLLHACSLSSQLKKPLDSMREQSPLVPACNRASTFVQGHPHPFTFVHSRPRLFIFVRRLRSDSSKFVHLLCSQLKKPQNSMQEQSPALASRNRPCASLPVGCTALFIRGPHFLIFLFSPPTYFFSIFFITSKSTTLI
jgi:hypothetical protein